MMVLFLGGVESTAGLIGTLFKLLAENPDQRALLQRDPTLIPDAVEEAIRIATPLQLVGRTTSREVTLHGVTIPAGGRVVLVYGAANRDERQFPDPDRFDVSRGRFRHLGFGEGMHGCLGAPLARLEAKVALEEALPVLGRLQARRRRPSATRPPRTCTSGRTCTGHVPGAGAPPSAGGATGTPRTSRRPRHRTTSDTTVVTRSSRRRSGWRRRTTVADGVVALDAAATSAAPAAPPGRRARTST